jgi:penicillin-binding protein-related factor A (putative recombinase)
MARNSGKLSEAHFEARFAKMGKRASVFRLVDASDIFGRSKNKEYLAVPSQPADYLVVCNGATFFAEVKSTQDKTAFRFSMIGQGQWIAAVKSLAAGGDYLFFVHNLLTNQWYRIPASYVKLTKDAGMNSLPWSELKPFMWSDC